jgi:hypothetical protein
MNHTAALPDLPPLPASFGMELADPFDAIASALQDALRSDPDMTVSQWADANRVLTGKAAAEPGPFRTDRTPYLRDIANALSEQSSAARGISKRLANWCNGNRNELCWFRDRAFVGTDDDRATHRWTCKTVFQTAA